MLELHVWGPAFGLPSIDAHCLAAIAYLQQAVPRGKWQLIASNNPASSPTNELPALRNTETGVWIGGFRNIFHYLAQVSAGEWVLDAGLPEQEGADCIAFSSFIESSGLPLLDLSLYVSSQNYTATTRPLYSSILPFPLPYLLPPLLRENAKTRTAHLGLSSLDIDTEGAGNVQPPSIIPKSLRQPRGTLSSLLATMPEANAQIRLDALAQDFFEPLEKLRNGKRYMVSDTQCSSLDCLVLGFGSLMLIPDLPQPWLSIAMRKHVPELCSWIKEMRNDVFGPETRPEDVMLLRDGTVEVEGQEKKKKRTHLPWAKPDRSALVVSRIFTQTLADSIPILGQLRRNTSMRQHGTNTPYVSQNTSITYLSIAGGLLASLGVAAFLASEGIINLPFGSQMGGGDEKRRLSDLGEAGEAFGVLAMGMDEDVRRREMLEREMRGGEFGGGAVGIESVEVEVGGGGDGVGVQVR